MKQTVYSRVHAHHQRHLGFTMIEVLIVVTILGLLGVAALTNVMYSMPKARDAQRKADLKKIASALEQYYNDFGGYPVQLSSTGTELSACGISTVLQPYMKEVPCDTGNRPFVYDPPTATFIGSRGVNVVRSYRLLTKLENSADPIIEATCPQSGVDHCGGGYRVTTGATETAITPSNILNFGVASGTTVLE